jgi:hypothetical protein
MQASTQRGGSHVDKRTLDLMIEILSKSRQSKEILSVLHYSQQLETFRDTGSLKIGFMFIIETRPSRRTNNNLRLQQKHTTLDQWWITREYQKVRSIRIGTLTTLKKPFDLESKRRDFSREGTCDSHGNY